MPSCLIIDRDASLSTIIESAFEKGELGTYHAADSSAGLQLVAAYRPNLAIYCHRDETVRWQDFIERARQVDPNLAVICITEKETPGEAIAVMGAGAYEYLVRPGNAHEREMLGQIARKAIECNIKCRRIKRLNLPGSHDGQTVTDEVMIGSSPVVKEIWKRVGKIANSDSAVLIQGESGTGKELLARAIYTHSRRCQRPFLAINCAALPDSLLEAELFGHEKGAFTDACGQRVGKFEQCAGGTLFFDEVGEMSHSCQAKLLRALDNHSFHRLGSNTPIRSDVRIIACTNRDLEVAVRQGRFRLDLYHRLRVVCFHLPPLRERVQDIPLLVEWFCQNFSRSCGKETCQVTKAALDLLMINHWEGNIRELRNVIHSAITLSSGRILDVDDFDEQIGTLRGFSRHDPPPKSIDEYYTFFTRFFNASGVGNTFLEYSALRQGLEKAAIQHALEKTDQSQVQASKLLNMSRNTLRNRLKQYWADEPANGADIKVPDREARDAGLQRAGGGRDRGLPGGNGTTGMS
jgi:two-component system, NtrC family, nitrogen regulation response regulator GlnG